MCIVHCAKLLFLACMFVFGDLRQVMPSKNYYVNECALQVFQRAADNDRRKEGKLVGGIVSDVPLNTCHAA